MGKKFGDCFMNLSAMYSV